MLIALISALVPFIGNLTLGLAVGRARQLISSVSAAAALISQRGHIDIGRRNDFSNDLISKKLLIPIMIVITILALATFFMRANSDAS